MSDLPLVMQKVFGGDSPEFPLTVGQVAVRAAVVYIVGIGIVRLGKSRLISRATPLDVILGFILGSLLSRGITGHAAISDTLLATAVLVGIHWLFTAVACHWPRIDAIIKGHAYPLMEDGVLQRHNMLQSHVTMDDLLEAVRLHGLDSLADVQRAMKERNGEVSILKRD